MTSARPTPTPAPTQTADDAQYYRRILHRFIDMATDLAEDIHDEALAPPAEPTAKPTRKPTKINYITAFDALGRAVRRFILLAREVAKPLPATPDPARHRTAARQTIIRTVEDTIQRHAEDEDADDLQGELLDRLDSQDLDADIFNRPVADIIAEICRDLGLAHVLGNHPWKRRTPADLAILRARAAAPTNLGATEATPAPHQRATASGPSAQAPWSDPAPPAPATTPAPGVANPRPTPPDPPAPYARASPP